jgi:hypothetical protein
MGNADCWRIIFHFISAAMGIGSQISVQITVVKRIERGPIIE